MKRPAHCSPRRNHAAQRYKQGIDGACRGTIIVAARRRGTGGCSPGRKKVEISSEAFRLRLSGLSAKEEDSILDRR